MCQTLFTIDTRVTMTRVVSMPWVTSCTISRTILARGPVLALLSLPLRYLGTPHHTSVTVSVISRRPGPPEWIHMLD